MAKIPKARPEEFIIDAMEDWDIPQVNRGYIGYSELGDPCQRRVWYNFRCVKIRTISRRIDRLFKRGDWEEHRIIEDLAHAGVIVTDLQKELIGFAGHIKGHIDAILKNVPKFLDNTIFLGEFKTCNDKYFKAFKKNGVKKTSKKYFYQSQGYMGELDLGFCLFIITNKNDEHRYIEIIEFEETEFDNIKGVALKILETDTPPTRIGGPTWFECKTCAFHDICHLGAKPLKNCRTCKYGTIEMHGVWKCGLTEKVLSFDEQMIGCVSYEKLQDL